MRDRLDELLEGLTPKEQKAFPIVPIVFLIGCLSFGFIVGHFVSKYW